MLLHTAAEIKKDQVLKASVEVWGERERGIELHLISVIKLAVSAAALSDEVLLHVCPAWMMRHTFTQTLRPNPITVLDH